MPNLTEKTCRICKKNKLISEFHLCGYRRKDGSSTARSDCKECSSEIHRKYVDENRKNINAQRSRAYKQNKTKAIESNLKRYYGIDLNAYNRLLEEQKGRCKLCFEHQSIFERRFDVDHDHKTGKVRGLLCIRCNRGIGLLRDDINVLKRAIKYLKQKS